MKIFEILFLILSYIIGSSNMAIYIAKIKKIDIKNKGSKNPGTSNAILLMGKKIGAIVALHDIGKGLLTVCLCKLFFPNAILLPFFTATATIIGHIFPFWMKFKGGKGFATYIGTSIALNWPIGLSILIIALVIAYITDYIVMGTFTLITINPIFYSISYSIFAGLILLIPTIIIYILHIPNIKRIKLKQEAKIKASLKGEYKNFL